MRILRNLRIDEVSAVIKGANPGARVLIRKTDKPDYWDDPPCLFDDIMAKANEQADDDITNDDPARTNTINDDDKLSGRLKAMVAALVTAAPSLSEKHAMHFLIHTAQGRKLAEHLNNISKHEKESPMPTVDIMKLHNIESVIEFTKSSGASEFVISEVIMGHAKLNKMAGESNQKAFSRILERNSELLKAYGLAKGGPNLMSIEPVSVEVGSSATADDSAKAYAQLQEKVAEQRKLAPTLTDTKLYEMVFAANPEPVKASVWYSAATR